MVRTLEFVEQLNDNLLATISDYQLRMAEAKADLAHYKSLDATQKDSILSLYAKLDEAEAARDEATARATHAEEELAAANWRAEENLRCCELRDTTIDALEGELEAANKRATLAEMEHALTLQELAVTRKAIKAAENGCAYHEKRAKEFDKALTIAESQCRDMEERATNAEYNAKHYWRELQAETNKARMYRQERDLLIASTGQLSETISWERRRYDEVARSKGAPLPHTMRIGNFTIASNAALGG